jgi:hypothetical protein
MYKSTISYDPSLNKTAGYYQLKEDKDKPLSAADKKQLLNLLFWLTYTKDGRDFVSTNRESPERPEAAIRSALLKKFRDDFGIIDEALRLALINAHLAADRWVQANNRMPDTKAALDRELHEGVYQQNISFVMWSLWEDAMGHDFSMNW